MTVRRMAFSVMSGLLAFGAASPAGAEPTCERAGRNAPVFEMLAVAASAHDRPGGGLACSWTFSRVGSAAGEVDLTVSLTAEPMASETAARQAVLLARLPENHRGKTVEVLVGFGDSSFHRSTIDNGLRRDLEFEAAKGRRRIVLTVQPRDGQPVDYRLLGQSINFFGVALGAF
jgi:hypothetical protein